MKILVINPGSTSTKVAIYHQEECLSAATISHDEEDLRSCPSLFDQKSIRKREVLKFLGDCGTVPQDIACVVSRGGTFGYAEGGAYEIDEALLAACKDPLTNHPSNLGAAIAAEIAAQAGARALIYDAVCVNETEDIARVTGLKDIKRKPFSHVLNTRAVCRKIAEESGTEYENMNIIAAHLGGGISINLHRKGRIVDVISDDAGPMSPERAGVISSTQLAALCYAGKYTKEEMMRRLKGRGGLIDHLGTSSVIEVYEMVRAGNKEAEFVLSAMAYQIAKGIASLASVVCGDVDRIVLTGGVAHCTWLTDQISRRVSFIAPVCVVPGEMEMQALAHGAFRVLSGKETAKKWGGAD